MAFADPQTVTISTVAVPMPRTGSSLSEGTFQSADGTVTFRIAHASGKRTRHLIKVTKTLIVADPLFPSQNTPVSYSVHISLDHPKSGVALADVAALGTALMSWATNANLTKVVGGES